MRLPWAPMAPTSAMRRERKAAVVPGLSDETAVDRDRPEELPWACPFLGVKTAFWPIECGNKRMIG